MHLSGDLNKMNLCKGWPQKKRKEKRLRTSIINKLIKKDISANINTLVLTK